MSIMQDPVPPLDPSSQQEFAERGREAAAEGEGPEPLEEARGLAAFRVPRPGPCTRGPQWAGASRSAN
jgi:hypothetical protein